MFTFEDELVKKLKVDVLSNKSLAHYYNGTYVQGQEDAEAALKLRPDDPKLFYRASRNSFEVSKELEQTVDRTKDIDLLWDFIEKLEINS